MRYIGGKWKAVILLHLIEKKRYSELRSSLSMVTERTISLQLKELEQGGLIKRTVHTAKPPLKVDCQLTEFGKTLIPVLKALADWGEDTAANNKCVKIV